MVHWLLVGGIRKTPSEEQKQWQNIKEYLEKYPDGKITIYWQDTNIFNKIVRLECKQKYNDLDLDCNSFFSGSIKHLDYKPKNLKLSKFQDINHYIKCV